MEIVTRQRAKTEGLLRFFTGRPCARGHLVERTTSSGICIACLRETMAKRRTERPEAVRRRTERAAVIEAHRVEGKEIVSRKEAKARGLPRYYTGVPCENGHVSERSTPSTKCLACHHERRARVRAERPEAIREQKARDYAKHRDRRVATVRTYQEREREKVCKRRKAYRAANKEKIAARVKAWSKANRPKLRVHERRRRDRKRGATGKHTFADIKALEASQQMRCANPRCGADLTSGYHIDHVMPLVLGGSDGPENLQLLCSPCNLSKGDLHPDDWRQRIHADLAG